MKYYCIKIFLYATAVIAFLALLGSSDTNLNKPRELKYRFIEDIVMEEEFDVNRYEFEDEIIPIEEIDSITPSATLFEAVMKGNLEETIKFIKSDSDINVNTESGEPLLLLAAESNNTKLVKFLLNKGADVNAKNKFGKTALHCAASFGNTDMIGLLVQHGADINAVYYDKYTPFYEATGWDDVEILKYLIKHGADLTVCETALRSLISTAYLDSYNEFRYIANLQPSSFKWEDVLCAAIDGGNLDIIKYLVEYKGVEVHNKIKDNSYYFNDPKEIYPIEAAARNRFQNEISSDTHLEIMKYLIAKGAKLTDINDGEIFPWAFEYTNDYMVDFFYDQGFSYEPVCEVDDRGWTSLAKSLDKNEFGMARCLLKTCKDSTFRGKPLIVYFSDGLYDSSDIIAFLIKQGINKEHYSEAFLESIKNNVLEGAIYLLEASADINYTCDRGLNALYYARRKTVIKELIERGIDIGNEKTLEKAWENLALLRVLHEMNIEPPMTVETANRGLHRSAIMGDGWSVNYFLSHGAEPDSMLPLDEEPYYVYDYEIAGISTALVKNCIYGFRQNSWEIDNQVSTETVEALIKAGADINLKDENGKTPLHHVAETWYRHFMYWPIPMGSRIDRERGAHGDPAPPYKQNHDLIAEVMINAGADIHAIDKDGNNPLILAVKYKNKRTVELLLNAGAKVNVRNKKGESPLSIAKKGKLKEIEELLTSFSE